MSTNCMRIGVVIRKYVKYLTCVSLLLQMACSVSVLKPERYDGLIEQERRTVADIDLQMEAIESNLQPIVSLQQYASSTEGEEFFVAGQCRTPPAKYIPVTPRPSDACAIESEVRRYVGDQCQISTRCALVGAMVALERLPKKVGYLTNLGCSATREDKDFLEGSIGVVTDTFCDIGANTGKQPKTKAGKSKLGLVYWAARAAACYSKVERLRKDIDDLSQCMRDKENACRVSYANWANAAGSRAAQIETEHLRVEVGFDRCKVSTALLRKDGPKTMGGVESSLAEMRSALKSLRVDKQKANERIVSLRTQRQAAVKKAKAKAIEKEKRENELRDM